MHGTKWKKADTAYKKGTEGVNLVLYMGSGGQDIVIKGLDSDGAQMQFAAKLYEEISETPDTRVIQTASKEGRLVSATLKKLVKKGKADNIDERTVNRLSGLKVLILMEKKALSTIERLAKELEPGEARATGLASGENVMRKMFHGGFFKDLGKIHAADMFLGNHDRLDPGMGSTQIQNIFIDITSGRALGMDLDVQASNLQSVKMAASTQNRQGPKTQAVAGNEYKDWVQLAIEGSMAKRDVQNVQTGQVEQKEFGIRVNAKNMGTANVAHLSDDAVVDLVIDNLKARMIRNFKLNENDPEAQRRLAVITGNQAADQKWVTAKRDFKLGIKDGVAQMAEGMASGRYKKYFDEAVQEHGGDAAFDYKVLQIRNQHLEAKKKFPNMAESRIRALLIRYAEFLDTGQGVNPFENLQVWQSPKKWVSGIPAD